jgi:aminoglycoside phosphotransferase family enzyme
MVNQVQQLLNDLQSPSAYPETTKNVRLVQTHISWVFVCDNYVYKLKKPVDFGFLDFTTIKKRELYCHKEVELNSRLAPDVYLGVYPVVYDGKVYRILEDKGDKETTVEYAVKMKVLPDSALMKTKFLNGTLRKKDIEQVAKTIAKFHSIAERSNEIDKFGELNTIKFNTDENFQQTAKYIGTSINQEQFNALYSWTAGFYEKNVDIFKTRIATGRIRDCHGDLHMEHVCLTDPIIIFDCIEFNDRFRYSDTASDLAFLMMDLDYHGGTELAQGLYEEYGRVSGEVENEAEFRLVVNFYKVYRAYVRGKVNSFRLDDPNISEADKAQAVKTAAKYFELAESYIKS